MKEFKDVVWSLVLIVFSAIAVAILLMAMVQEAKAKSDRGNHGKNAAHSNHDNNGGHDNHELVRPVERPEPPLPKEVKRKKQVRIITVYTSGNSSSPLPVHHCQQWLECSYNKHTNMISWKPKGNRAESKKACLTYLGY